MGAYSGPEITNDGLVFAYDMANTQKSWKGAPTTNLLAYSDSLNGGLWSGYCGGTSNVTYKTTDIVAPDGSYNATKLVMDGSTGCGAGAAWGLLYGQSAIFTSGQTYTVSIWARCSTGTVTTTMGLGMNDSFSIGVTLTTTWQRFSYTATITGNLDRGLQFIRGDSTIGKTIYVWGAQCEQNSFATPYISSPTSSTTRANTQTILDQTNNNTITATSLTYASDGTFSFNGSNNYLTISTFINKPTTAITVEAWIKPTKPTLSGTIRGGAISATNSMYLGIIDSIDGGLTHALHWASQTSVSRIQSWNGNIPNNAWSHIAGTYDGTTMRAYINGVQVYSAAQTGTIPDAIYVLGTYGGALTDGVHNFNGLIPASKIYNRALTADEMKQNFNAMRGRFNI
jgi:hypothetical protein